VGTRGFTRFLVKFAKVHGGFAEVLMCSHWGTCVCILSRQSLLVQVTPDAPFPPLTWADLSAAARVHFNATEFIEINQISLTLLHPLSRTDTPNAVHFLSW
jgi:hypothetical protein